MNRTITCTKDHVRGRLRLHDDHGWSCHLRVRQANDGTWFLPHLPERVFGELSNAVIRDLRDQAVPDRYLIESVKAVVRFLR